MKSTVETQKPRPARSTKPTRKIVLTILDLLRYGLTNGKGRPEPGKMCVEAAVCFAYGLPHGDEPPCVGYAVREFKIRLNDCWWPSNMDRANGMRELAIAQLGSNELDQMAFGKLMYLRGTQILLPFVFRKCADELSSKAGEEMREWADKLAAVTTFEEARSVARSASAHASAHASAYASASAYAHASAYASAYTYAYASASAYTSAYAPASAYFKHALLKLTAQVGVDALKEMKSPGCRWLHLAKAPSVPNAVTTEGVPQ